MSLEQSKFGKIKKTRLTIKKPKAELKFRMEFPYFRITNYGGADGFEPNLDDLKLKLHARHSSGMIYDYGPVSVSEMIRTNEMPEWESNEHDLVSAELELIDVPESLDLEFYLDVFYVDENLFIPMEGPFDAFDNHIRQHFNAKIMFTAPFGSGKTTFLREYFERNQNDFTDYWVNVNQYSVSPNEDVIRYIKCDIICQLIMNGVDFDRTQEGAQETGKKFIGENIHRILAPFLLLVPQVGGNLYKMFEEYDGLKDEYFQFHAGQQFEGNAEMIELVESMYNIGGGIYEQDFYTHLITKMLSKHRAQSEKRNVLIIDDLDRIDPEHAFRILNVLSVHIDPVRPTDDFNKFGFNKIIVVCDVNNLKRIFEHRYGKGVEFQGYINKYFSHAPFEYDNKDAVSMAIQVDNSVNQTIQRDDHLRHLFEIVRKILLDFHEADELSLREILKLRLNNFVTDMNAVCRSPGYVHTLPKHMFVQVIEYLIRLTDFDDLERRFRICLDREIRDFGDFDYDFYMRFGLVFISEPGVEKRKATVYIALQRTSNTKSVPIETVPLDNGLIRGDVIREGFNFSKRDFYIVLIRSLQKYRDIRRSISLQQ